MTGFHLHFHLIPESAFDGCFVDHMMKFHLPVQQDFVVGVASVGSLDD